MSYENDLNKQRAEAISEYIQSQEEKYWRQVRINASISVLNSLLETTQHSVIEEAAVKDIYARVAVAYADSLVKELRKNPDWFDKLIEI
jgi:DNA-binding ferritin-like protein (Dps family)